MQLKVFSQDLEIGCPDLSEISKQGVQIKFTYNTFTCKWQMK